MGKRTKEEKLKIAEEIAVALAPYLWSRTWGFGMNMYFDDVHVDFREINSYIFSEDQAEDGYDVVVGFENFCVEYGELDDKTYQTYKEVTSLDPDIEMYISCEQEIYEQIYLCYWEGQPGGIGIVDYLKDIFSRHNMIWNLEDYSIVVYSDDK